MPESPASVIGFAPLATAKRVVSAYGLQAQLRLVVHGAPPPQAAPLAPTPPEPLPVPPSRPSDTRPGDDGEVY